MVDVLFRPSAIVHDQLGRPYSGRGTSRVRTRSIADRFFRLAWLLVLAATVVLLVASTPAVARWLEGYLGGDAPVASDIGSYPQAAAIVVLGGEENTIDDLSDPNDNSETRSGLGRLLLLSHRAPVILLSGGKGEAKRMKSRLLAQGVSSADILTETRSRDTRENALDSAPILKRIGAHRILLVTSSYHMRRAAGTFRKLGFKVIPAPSAEWPAYKPTQDFWRRREHALKCTEEALHEIFGLWIYECLGWA